MLRKYRRPAFALGLVAAVALLLAIVAGVSNAPQVPPSRARSSSAIRTG